VSQNFHYTEEQIRKIERVLKPPSDFNLRKRLDTAIQDYFLIIKPAFLEAPKIAEIKRAMKKVCNRAKSLITSLDKFKPVLLNQFDPDVVKAVEDEVRRLAYLCELKMEHIEDLKHSGKLPKKGGRYIDYPFRNLLNDLLTIYEDAGKEVKAPSRNKYGEFTFKDPIFRYMSLCLKSLDSTLKHVSICNAILRVLSKGWKEEREKNKRLLRDNLRLLRDD
jgi:hypothetical protein